MRTSFAIILFTFIFSFLNVNSQNYSIMGTLLDGSNISTGSILSENDSCTFKLVDTEGSVIDTENCEWSLEVLKKDSEYLELITDSDNKDFCFKLDTLSLPEMFVGKYNLDLVTSDNGLSRYIQAKIVCRYSNSANETTGLEIPLYLNLLPKNPTFSYRKEPSTDEGINRFYFTINTENASNVLCNHKTHIGRRSVTITYDCPLNKLSNYEVLASGDSLSVQFVAYNYYGFSYSEIVVIPLEKVTTGIDQAEQKSFSIYPNPVTDYLKIDGEIDNIEQLTISDNTGKIIYNTLKLNNNILNFTSYSTGIYFIQIKYKNLKKGFVSKIIKH